MIPSFAPSLVAFVVAAHVLGSFAAPSQHVSPCPNLFRYDSVNDPGRWTGNLVLQSDDELHGVWIRVIFDAHPQKVTAEGYEVVGLEKGENEVLIKNRDALLKSGSPRNVKITVEYDGDKFPHLISYRLNARTVCPEFNTIRKDYFRGDENAKDFFSVIQSHAKHIALKPGPECGVRNKDTIPWQAFVSLKKDGSEQYICDATLISSSHLILPAHCVTFNYDVDKVPAETLSVTLPGHKDSLAVSKVTVHRGYDPYTLIDDVAVLDLKSVLDISDSVRPVCLKNPDTSEGKLELTGKEIRPGNDGPLVAETDVEQVDPSSCVARNPSLSGLILERTFCISHVSDTSPCIGNSGSSVVTFDNNVGTLKGFVTLGPILQHRNQCDVPALAINIQDYYQWILRTIS